MFRSRQTSLALVGLFVWATGCTSWTPIGISDVPDHGSVRVTLANGERATLREANVIGDSISGFVEKRRPRPRLEDVQRSFAIDQVSEIQAKGTDVAGTVVLAVLGAGLVAALIALATYDMCILDC